MSTCVYSLNTMPGAVSSAQPIQGLTAALTTPVDSMATHFGFDVDPGADLLHLVSDMCARSAK
jgi:hypothetical protein